MALFARTSRRFKRLDPISWDRSEQQQPGAPVHHVMPGARELRAQAVHRLQVGLFGLAAMLLMVSLANIIMDRVKYADRSAITADPSAEASPANDPLVDLGVAPELPSANDAGHRPAKTATTH